MSWAKGADTIGQLLTDGHLEHVPADPAEASYLLERARQHLDTAAQVASLDPEIAYDALYAAARKALTAVLRQQGLRPTRAGGHEAVIQAAEAQLVPPGGPVLRPYRRLRRRRGEGDYQASEGAIEGEQIEEPGDLISMPGVELDMNCLGNPELAADELVAGLLPMVTGYRSWLSSQRERVEHPTGDDQEIADFARMAAGALDDADEVTGRLERAVELLRENGLAREAFRSPTRRWRASA